MLRVGSAWSDAQRPAKRGDRLLALPLALADESSAVPPVGILRIRLQSRAEAALRGAQVTLPQRHETEPDLDVGEAGAERVGGGEAGCGDRNPVAAIRAPGAVGEGRDPRRAGRGGCASDLLQRERGDHHDHVAALPAAENPVRVIRPHVVRACAADQNALRRNHTVHWRYPKFTVWVRLKARSEEHTSELQSNSDIVCRLLLGKKKNIKTYAVLMA